MLFFASTHALTDILVSYLRCSLTSVHHVLPMLTYFRLTRTSVVLVLLTFVVYLLNDRTFQLLYIDPPVVVRTPACY